MSEPERLPIVPEPMSPARTALIIAGVALVLAIVAIVLALAAL
jgi:hypothetical protein